eukprot:CAMPEP_0174232938 /NCGR_PEP_ID=MMETSP0417-20130205/3100_1 /TAXON_ID=242541 /ORGANISM="Mayorella sp, Strain BSH-02190019" /LENGTH=660 /DNA_ID=CAMNT_0015311073 /DNA_START=37 /DNA_END=2019 /DNA_ORIENTATION=-
MSSSSEASAVARGRGRKEEWEATAQSGSNPSSTMAFGELEAHQSSAVAAYKFLNPSSNSSVSATPRSSIASASSSPPSTKKSIQVSPSVDCFQQLNDLEGKELSIHLPGAGSGVLLQWRVSTGQQVAKGDVLAVFMSNSHLPTEVIHSPFDLIIRKQLAEPGTYIEDGARIGIGAITRQKKTLPPTPKERRKRPKAHKFDTEHISEEIARLTKKQRSVEETIAKAGEEISPELLHLEAEVSLRLEQKRRQLLEVYKVLKRRQVQRLEGKDYANMDVASIKHLAKDLPSFPLAPLKYTPTPTEVLKAEIVKHIAEADGPDDHENEVMIHPIVFAQTVSTYPYRIKESKREGDPICDHFNMKVYENRLLVAVADGCSWGEEPRQAARRCTNAFLKYMASTHEHLTDTHEVGYELLEAFAEAHNATFEGYDDVFRAGTSTLVGGILFQLDSPNPDTGHEWAFVFASVGDCMCFRWDALTATVYNVTPGQRANLDARDCGGRLGPMFGYGKPDLRNLAVRCVTCNRGDIFLMCSDGVHDNLDPVTLGKTPSDFGLSEENWDDVPFEIADKLKEEFQCTYLADRIIGDHIPTPKLIVSRTIRHCLNTTSRSRKFMEKYPDRKLPDDYNAYPGKMDHTTCLCFRVGAVSREDIVIQHGNSRPPSSR